MTVQDYLEAGIPVPAHFCEGATHERCEECGAEDGECGCAG